MIFADPEKRASYEREVGAGIARRLREARLEAELSTTALARAAGVGRQTVINAERDDGAGVLAICSVAALADALGVHRAWLGFGVPPKK